MCNNIVFRLPGKIYRSGSKESDEYIYEDDDDDDDYGPMHPTVCWRLIALDNAVNGLQRCTV